MKASPSFAEFDSVFRAKVQLFQCIWDIHQFATSLGTCMTNTPSHNLYKGFTLCVEICIPALHSEIKCYASFIYFRVPNILTPSCVRSLLVIYSFIGKYPLRVSEKLVTHSYSPFCKKASLPLMINSVILHIFRFFLMSETSLLNTFSVLFIAVVSSYPATRYRSFSSIVLNSSAIDFCSYHHLDTSHRSIHRA